MEVLDILRAHNIYLCKVPTKMIQLFQPLDLMDNNHCKVFMIIRFGEWFGKQVKNSLKLGLKREKIDIKFRLTTMKPLHAYWLIEFHNTITSASRSSIIINGWKIKGIFELIKMVSAKLPSLDPFPDISPLKVPSTDFSTHFSTSCAK